MVAVSQPKPTSKYPPMFGCRAMPPITRLRIWWCSPPNSIPQPLPCENANTPSTLGKSRSRSGVNRAATYRATDAEQFTLLMMAM